MKFGWIAAALIAATTLATGCITYLCLRDPLPAGAAGDGPACGCCGQALPRPPRRVSGMVIGKEAFLTPGDVEQMQKGFHPDAKMLFIRDGALVQVTMPEWFDRIRKAPPNGTKATSRKIVSLDVAGNAAAVKAVSEFPTFRFIDYLSLLKVDGEWRIVGKIFFREEK